METQGVDGHTSSGVVSQQMPHPPHSDSLAVGLKKVAIFIASCAMHGRVYKNIRVRVYSRFLLMYMYALKSRDKWCM